MSFTAAFIVACGADDASNPVGSGGGGSSGSAGAGRGGAVGSSGSNGLGGASGAGVTGGAGTAGAPSTGGAGTGGAGTGGAGTGGAGTGGVTAKGGSGGALVGSGGAAGELGAAGDDGAAGAPQCAGDHGCPEPTIFTTTHPNGLALDSTYVYWTTVAASGTVQRAPIAGGAAQPVATGEPDAFDLAVAGGNAFWLLNDSNVGEVVEGSLAGTNRLQLTAGVATGFVPALSNVSSDGTSVYFVANFNDIAKIPVGAATTTSPPPYISLGPTNSNVIDMVLFGNQLYYTNNGVFFSDYSGKMPHTAAIRSVDPAAGNGSITLVSQLDFPLFQIAVDSAHIFWNNDQEIYSTGLIGGLASPIVAVDPVAGGTAVPFPPSPVSDMVSDGVNLYYADAHTVYRIPVGGGARHTLSFGWQSIQHLAVDANHLYLTDYDGNAVAELAK